jgi:hypothetical protein
MTSTLKSQFPSVLPWMAGASAAFVVRMLTSFGGMDGHNADALAMYLFLSVSVMILAWSQCAPVLLRDCRGAGMWAARVLPLATLSLASAMTGVFVSLLIRDF